MKSKIIHIFVLLGFLITTQMQASFSEKLKPYQGFIMFTGVLVLGLIGGTMYPLWKKDKTEKPLSNNENIVLYKRNGNYFIKDKNGERNLKYYLDDKEQSIDNVLNLQVDFINDQQPPEINEEQELQELRDFKKKAQGFSVQLREGSYNLKSNNPSVKLYQICKACDKKDINPSTNDFTVNLAAVIEKT